MVARNQASETGRMLDNFGIFFKWRTSANAFIWYFSLDLSCRNFDKKTPEPIIGSGVRSTVVEIKNSLALGKLRLLPGLAQTDLLAFDRSGIPGHESGFA